MKNALFALSALILTATSAHAAPLVCNTNVDNNPRKGNNYITINTIGRDNRVEVILESNGGMAKFVTAPEKFDAIVTHFGPEVVKYVNKEKGFVLTVNFMRMGGKIFGSVTAPSAFIELKDAPVTCVQALN
ncbi:MAG: hypothetical protein ACXVB9_07085 [Bdellovibrionota bacterium]